MSLVKWENKAGVALLEMCHEGNRHNLGFATELDNALDEIIADSTVNSLVLTSSDLKIFSNGIDVDWMMKKFGDSDFDSIKAFMTLMNGVFKKIILFPVPVIAAINGHAFGNGAILACACDFRFMRSDRGYFCFPEVDLGIPFLPGMLAFVKKAIPQYKFNEMYLTGRRLGADELEKAHVIEKACANTEELMKEAMAFAATFAKKRGIFKIHKERIYKSVIEIMDNEDPPVIDSLALFVTD